MKGLNNENNKKLTFKNNEKLNFKSNAYYLYDETNEPLEIINNNNLLLNDFGNFEIKKIKTLPPMPYYFKRFKITLNIF